LLPALVVAGWELNRATHATAHQHSSRLIAAAIFASRIGLRCNSSLIGSVIGSLASWRPGIAGGPFTQLGVLMLRPLESPDRQRAADHLGGDRLNPMRRD
jgi:hypothetical protein